MKTATLLRTSAISAILPLVVMAQTPADLAAPQSTAIRKPDFKVQLISPNGVKSAPQELQGVQLETASSERDQILKDLLGSKGLALDKKSLAAVRTLNPSLKADGTVPAGTKITYYAPHLVAGQLAPGEKTAFDMALAAKYQVGAERTVARTVRQETIRMPSTAYEQKADMAMHRQLVASIEETATLVESRADKLTARDLALSKYYLSEANAQSQRLSSLTAANSIRTDSVEQLKLTVQPLEGMRTMMKKTVSPIEYRAVNVKVSGPPAGPPAEPLRVYVLPGGMLDRPETYTLAELKDLLIALSFENLTSPSRSMVAQGDMRLWVGPDHAYDAMAKRILQSAPIRFKAVLPATDNGPERQIEFEAPTDVVQP
ncbi:MAG: hypothetical protein QM740_21255 [Acidovorax sp.]